jgi:hypothetical protein
MIRRVYGKNGELRECKSGFSEGKQELLTVFQEIEWLCKL